MPILNVNDDEWSRIIEKRKLNIKSNEEYSNADNWFLIVAIIFAQRGRAGSIQIYI